MIKTIFFQKMNCWTMISLIYKIFFSMIILLNFNWKFLIYKLKKSQFGNRKSHQGKYKESKVNKTIPYIAYFNTLINILMKNQTDINFHSSKSPIYNFFHSKIQTILNTPIFTIQYLTFFNHIILLDKLWKINDID